MWWARAGPAPGAPRAQCCPRGRARGAVGLGRRRRWRRQRGPGRPSRSSVIGMVACGLRNEFPPGTRQAPRWQELRGRSASAGGRDGLSQSCARLPGAQGTLSPPGSTGRLGGSGEALGAGGDTARAGVHLTSPLLLGHLGTLLGPALERASSPGGGWRARTVRLYLVGQGHRGLGSLGWPWAWATSCPPAPTAASSAHDG